MCELKEQISARLNAEKTTNHLAKKLSNITKQNLIY